jgi:hypothetical protein
LNSCIYFHCSKCSLWYGIVTTGMKRMAVRYPPATQPHSFKQPIFFYSFISILRTGGYESAGRWRHTGNGHLVNFYHTHGNCLHTLYCLTFPVIISRFYKYPA